MSPSAHCFTEHHLDVQHWIIEHDILHKFKSHFDPEREFEPHLGWVQCLGCVSLSFPHWTQPWLMLIWEIWEIITSRGSDLNQWQQVAFSILDVSVICFRDINLIHRTQRIQICAFSPSFQSSPIHWSRKLVLTNKHEAWFYLFHGI